MVPKAIPAAGMLVFPSTSPGPATLVIRIGLPGAVMLLGVEEESGSELDIPADKRESSTIRDGKLASLEVNGGPD